MVFEFEPSFLRSALGGFMRVSVAGRAVSRRNSFGTRLRSIPRASQASISAHPFRHVAFWGVKKLVSS